MQAKKELDATNAEVERIERLMAELNAKFETAKEERAVLQAETELMMRRLDAADRLINGLASENDRSAPGAGDGVIISVCGKAWRKDRMYSLICLGVSYKSSIFQVDPDAEGAGGAACAADGRLSAERRLPLLRGRLHLGLQEPAGVRRLAGRPQGAPGAAVSALQTGDGAH